MISDEVKRALMILNFDKFDVVPKMKQLRQRFLKLCIDLHPDKGGPTDKFQELPDAKNIVSNYILTHAPGIKRMKKNLSLGSNSVNVMKSK